jgi:serine/threonine protein kinase
MNLLNKTIGKYTLTKYIGEGGMASVYEGTHLFLGTKAAVKVLSPMLSKNDQFRQRFRNEAAFMASLDHPNITKVLDFEDSDEVLAIVMELLSGSDLNDLVKDKGALTFDEFKPLFVQILDAFKYAHEKGIIHRDIKPSNIYILPNGQVKILDFGIAKLFGQGNEMTQTGTQMGTPAYMSPEQVKGDKSIDHRSDIYSLGVTLFYAIEGRPPYDTENESQFDIFNKIVYEELQLLSSNSESAVLIQKACQKNRELRFQSCEEWSVALNGDEKQPRKEVADKTKVENFVNEKTKQVSIEDSKEVKQEKKSESPLNFDGKSRLARIAFVLSLIGLFSLFISIPFTLFCFISLFVSILTLIFVSKVNQLSKKHRIKNKWMSYWAMISSVFVIIISIFLILIRLF